MGWHALLPRPLLCAGCDAPLFCPFMFLWQAPGPAWCPTGPFVGGTNFILLTAPLTYPPTPPPGLVSVVIVLVRSALLVLGSIAASRKVWRAARLPPPFPLSLFPPHLLLLALSCALHAGPRGGGTLNTRTPPRCPPPRSTPRCWPRCCACPWPSSTASPRVRRLLCACRAPAFLVFCRVCRTLTPRSTVMRQGTQIFTSINAALTPLLALVSLPNI